MLRRRRDDANAKSSGTSHSLHKSLDGHGKATSGILKNAYMLITTILSIAYISQLIGFDASCKDIRLHAEGRNDQVQYLMKANNVIIIIFLLYMVCQI